METQTSLNIIVGVVLGSSIDLLKENDITLKKVRSRRYPEETITDAVYAYIIVHLANTLTLGKSLLHCLKQAAGGIGFHENADETDYMRFNQKGDVFTLNGSSLKPGDKFIYNGSSKL